MYGLIGFFAAFIITLGCFCTSPAGAVGNAKDFFAHEKRLKKQQKKRLRDADKKTKKRRAAQRKRVGASEKYIAKRKRILKRKADREKLYAKREERRKKKQANRLARALKQAEKRRRRQAKSPIPPDREYGIKVMPVKNPPKKKTEIDPDFIY